MPPETGGEHSSATLTSLLSAAAPTSAKVTGAGSFRDSFRTPGATPSSTTGDVVGIATRLVNSDATPTWGHMLVGHPSGLPSLVALNGATGGLSYALVHPNDTPNFSAQYPGPAFSNFGFPVPHFPQQQILYRNHPNPMFMFHPPGGPSAPPAANMSYSLPSSMTERLPSGYGASTPSAPLFFQYPLHHLTGGPPACSQLSETGSFDLAAPTPVQARYCTVPLRPRSSPTQPMHPVRTGNSECSSGHHADITEPTTSSSTTACATISPTIMPASVFDDAENDVPQDLSQHSREPAPTYVNDIVRAAVEWQNISQKLSQKREKDETRLDSAVSLLTSLREYRDVRDHVYIHVRSVLSQLPKHYRDNIDMVEPEVMSEDLLRELGLTSKKRQIEIDVSNVSDVSDEMPVDGLDVDQEFLRNFVQNLLDKSTVQACPPADTTVDDSHADRDFLRAVGLVEKDECESGRKESLLTRRLKRRKTSKSFVVSGNVVAVSEELDVAARAGLRRQLQSSLKSLTEEMRRIKEKITAVKRLAKEEKQCSESDVSGLLAELETLLAD